MKKNIFLSLTAFAFAIVTAFATSKMPAPYFGLVSSTCTEAASIDQSNCGSNSAHATCTVTITGQSSHPDAWDQISGSDCITPLYRP